MLSHNVQGGPRSNNNNQQRGIPMRLHNNVKKRVVKRPAIRSNIIENNRDVQWTSGECLMKIKVIPNIVQQGRSNDPNLLYWTTLDEVY